MAPTECVASVQMLMSKAFTASKDCNPDSGQPAFNAESGMTWPKAQCFNCSYAPGKICSRHVYKVRTRKIRKWDRRIIKMENLSAPLGAVVYGRKKRKSHLSNGDTVIEVPQIITRTHFLLIEGRRLSKIFSMVLELSYHGNANCWHGIIPLTQLGLASSQCI